MAHDFGHERVGIKRVIVDPDLIVKMRARGFSTTAHERDDVTFFDNLAFVNENVFQVPVFGEHTLAMDDRYIVPEVPECGREPHDTVGWGDDRSAWVIGDIKAFMLSDSAGHGIDSLTESTGKPALSGRDQRQGAQYLTALFAQYKG